MNQHYNANYKIDQICSVLDMFKDCVRENSYIISKNENRQENIDFINEYRLTSIKQSKILLSIEPEDFCYTLQNINVGYEHEILYVFCPQVKLLNINDKEEEVRIYVKFNIIYLEIGKRVVVISFHKPNKHIEYVFK